MKKAKLVFLGDSLTMRNNWSDFGAANMGIDGDTTAGILSRLHMTSQANTIVLMAGVNDILNRIPLIKVQKNYIRILESFSKEQDIYILSLLPVIDDKQTKTINQEIRTLNKWLQTESTKRQMIYINLHSSFLDAQKKGLKDSFTTDGIHLTSKAYKLWSNTLRKQLLP